MRAIDVKEKSYSKKSNYVEVMEQLTGAAVAVRCLRKQCESARRKPSAYPSY